MENIYQKLNKHHVIGNDRLLLGPVTWNDAGETFFYASGQENTRWTFIANKSLDKTRNVISSIILWGAGV